MYFKDYVVRGLRKGYRFINKKSFNPPISISSRAEANSIIYKILDSEKGCMIARLGTTELITINNYLCIISPESFINKIHNYIIDNTHTPWWFEDHFHYMNVFSGIFPSNVKIAETFSKRYLNDIPLIDILGSFQYYEKFMPFNANIVKVHLEALYPFFVQTPWTKILTGKKVLVVHPFEETIIQQYSKREFLFKNKDTLPDFTLFTIKAVQSSADIKVSFEDWFGALKYMEDKIEAIDFDICLLGCGAYGLPLAAFVKRLGKKAVHLGGGLQLLFGIKGKRWDDPLYGSHYKIPGLFEQPYNSLYNEYWTKPLAQDTPSTANLVDGAVYW